MGSYIFIGIVVLITLWCIWREITNNTVFNAGLRWCEEHPPRKPKGWKERAAASRYSRDYSVRIRLAWLEGDKVKYDSEYRHRKE